MTQIARPIVDVTVTDWATVGGASVGLFAALDEATRNDSDAVRSILDPAAAALVVKLSSFTLPTVKTGWALDYAYRKNADGEDAIDLTVELRQGYVNAGTPGTLIASATHAAIGGPTWTAATLALSEAEGTAVTDPTELYVQIMASTGA